MDTINIITAEGVVEMCRQMTILLTFNRTRSTYRNPLQRAIEDLGGEERLEYIEHVARMTPKQYHERWCNPGHQAEDWDEEFQAPVWLSDFTCLGELADYLITGKSLCGQYIIWGAEGQGYFHRFVRDYLGLSTMDDDAVLQCIGLSGDECIE